MTEIATQVVTAIAVSASTLGGVALTLIATARGERLHRNHQERQEAAVTFLATYDAFYFACRNYRDKQIDALPIEIRPTQLTAGARVELFFPRDVRAAARKANKSMNRLWKAVQLERSREASRRTRRQLGADRLEGESVDELLTQAEDARTVFLQLARVGVGES